LTATRVALILAFLSAILPSLASAQTRAADAPAAPGSQALERELQRVLAEPDFQRGMRAGGQDSRDLGRWLLLQLRRLLDRLGGLHQTNYALFLVSVIVGSAVLLALLAHIAYTLVRALRRSGRPAAGTDGAPRERPQTPDDLRRRADELAERGEFREAVRALFLALIRSLQLKGLLPRSGSQTNAENLRRLRDHVGLVAVVRPFTETFDSRWYGRRPTSAQDVSRCREWFEAALREVEGP